MKQKDTIFDLLQNSAVGAIAMHSFTLGYYKIAKHKGDENNFPPAGFFFYVLPIVYNEKAMNTVKNCIDLYSVIIKEKSIMLGLQHRANRMTPKTFSSLNMAFSKKILTPNLTNGTIELQKGFMSKKILLPDAAVSDSLNSVKKIQDCAFRLGGIFAKRSAVNIQSELNILL